ncbi:MAG: CHAT domain-containing tetratricopeptide repeat protein [Candidatus Bipolaricaulota bacterium]|nr:CHAT domain-containing tetratricopeptide repeat protein [Candidatus Bipolaricaulota bacterium]MDW8127431.1 CHAT domain-containing protein [Candidatus Bipolaricaulota bacterium]
MKRYLVLIILLALISLIWFDGWAITHCFAGTLIEEAQALMASEKWEHACQVLLKALPLYAEEDHRLTRAKLWVLLGRAYLNSEVLHLAWASFREGHVLTEQACEKLSTSEAKETLAWALLGLGDVVYSLGKPAEALAYYERAAEMFEELEDKKAWADTQFRIGDLMRYLGYLEEALIHYGKARSIYVTHQWESALIDVLIRLGHIWVTLGRYEDAILLFSDALEKATQAGDQKRAGQILIELGEVYEALGIYVKAIECWDKAKAILWDCRAWRALTMLYLNLARIQAVLGPYSQVLMWLSRAVEAVDLALGDLDALPCLQGIPWTRPLTRVDLRRIQGQAFLLLNQPAQAKQALEQAASILNWAPWYISPEKFSTYEDLLHILLELGEGEQAVVWAEHWRTRQFKNVCLKENDLSSSLRWMSLDDLTRLSLVLHNSEAVLSYQVGRKGVYLWVITSTRIGQPLYLPYPYEALVQDIVSVRVGLERLEPLFVLEENLAALYETLVRPGLAQLAPEITTLVIIPSGPLWYLPFAALPMTDHPLVNVGPFLQRPPYLVEHYALAFLSGMQELLHLEEVQTDDRTSSAIFSYCPQEALCPWVNPAALSAIGQLPGGEPIRMYEGEQASTEALVQALADARYLVLLVPNKSDPANPWSSFFTLFDQPYQLWEVAKVSVQGMELVFIPTQDALSDWLGWRLRQTLFIPLTPVSGKEPSSQLPPLDGLEASIWYTAFRTAGVQTVFQTSWCPNPLAFAEVFSHLCFYRASGPSWAEALALAQRKLLQTEAFAHPWFWAPYQLVGRWR